MANRRVIFVLLVLATIICLIFLRNSDGRKNASYQHNEGLVFGTVFHASYLYDRDLQAEIKAELGKVDASLSMFNPKSTISRINKGESNEADEMLSEVLRLSFSINKATDGAFDPTVAPLVNAWGFGFKKGQLPDNKQVDSLLALVGLSGIHIEGNNLTKDNPLSILDFSAIAKGYGVDRAAEVLRGKGIKNFMVEIGGEVVTEGLNEKGEPWRIGINGRKIAHTINPKTGYPAQQDILSSTVMAPTCAEADAFATAFMVLGMDGARQILQSRPQLEAYFICSDEQGNYKTWCTEGFRKLLVK